MKNEERIVELLAEYMQKTDRLSDKVDRLSDQIGKTLERLDKHDILFEKQMNRMDMAYQVIIGHSEKIESLQKETKEIRGESLKHTIQNEVLLKEILSISKRVVNLEESQSGK